MRAVQIEKYGGSDVLSIVDRAVPSAKPGEVTVRLAYAGVNFTDVYRRQGHYARSGTYPTELPLILGIEGGGEVAALGEEVSELAIGDRVVFFVPNGAYAEYAVANTSRIARVPDDVSLDSAVALMIQGLTAHYLTHSAYALKAGDTCLVHAAAGGVGQLLVQIAKLKGARVIATTGSDQKAAVARRLGADCVIPYRQTDFREAVLKITDGRGVDVVYDSVGKDTLHGSLRSLRPRGMCVLFGHSSGMVESIAPMDLAEAGSVFLTRPHMQHYVATREELNDRMTDLFKWLAAGQLEIGVDRVLPLHGVAQAHDLLEGRWTAGKLLLDCSRGPLDEKS
jgi:NADPH2:quinone reductase